MDPNRIKVDEWKKNKERNIRALLGSLDDVVWSDCKWQKAGMHQLIEASDVKKMYRKACLAVHPDKVRIKYIDCRNSDDWKLFN